MEDTFRDFVVWLEYEAAARSDAEAWLWDVASRIGGLGQWSSQHCACATALAVAGYEEPAQAARGSPTDEGTR
jgi:hypothetical protein